MKAADGSSELKADAVGPLAAGVFKTTADPYVGKLTYLRVYSGTLKADSHVWDCQPATVDERIGQVFVVRGKNAGARRRSWSPATSARSPKLGETVTGDTLTTKEKPITLPPIDFPEPVFNVAVYPKSKADTEKMSSALARIVEEDPVLNVHRDPDTGETILSGLGESHVEIACEKMKRKFGADVGPPDAARALQGDDHGRAVDRVHAQEAERRPRPVRQGDVEDRAAAAWLRLRVRQQDGRRLRAEAVRAGGRGRRARGAARGRAGPQPGGRHPRQPRRRQGAPGRLARKWRSSSPARRRSRQGATKAHPVLLEPIVNVRVQAPETYTGDLVSATSTASGRTCSASRRRSTAP